MISQRLFTKRRSGVETTYTFTVKNSFLELDNPLSRYCEKVLIEGLDLSSSNSASQMPTGIINRARVEHELTQFATQANYEGKGKNQHLIVQDYLINNDPKTVIYELPLNDGTTSCFVDIVRYVDGIIEVYDFKPNAHKEKHACTQIYHNMRLLSQMAKIPFNKIIGGYFDKDNFYKLIF